MGGNNRQRRTAKQRRRRTQRARHARDGGAGTRPGGPSDVAAVLQSWEIDPAHEALVADALLHTPEATGAPSFRRIPVDNPYANAKASLVSVVADANRCQAVHAAGLGWGGSRCPATTATWTPWSCSARRCSRSDQRDGAAGVASRT